MDPEVATTLAELERKLQALERTLGDIGRRAGGEDRPEPDAPGTGPADAVPSGRIVDERIERVTPRPSPAPPVYTPSALTPTTSESAPAPPAFPLAPSSGAAPAQPPRVPLDWRAPSPARTAPPTAPAAPRYAEPPAARPGPASAPARERALAPSAGELLRFRERLERAARDLTHDYDELLGRLSYAAMPSTQGPTISFARGVPSLDIIDVEGLRDAAVRAFDSDPAGTTAYGTSVGYPRLRSWIADRHGVDPEHVLVTNGSLQADAFLFDHLVHAGDDVIVESPTYDRTLLSLRNRGAQVHPVALEHDGIDTEALARLLSAGAGVRPKLAHIIPNFQNPAGYTLSLPKRERLLALAREHDFLVLEDDPYAELRFSGEPMPTMVSMDPERVVYASSFTKTVCPGVRVGYLLGSPGLIAAIGSIATNTYISPNMVSESIVYEFCASGAITRSIETVRTALAERARTLGEALRRELAEAEFVAPQGGYFMWVTLPPGTDVNALFDAGAARGVTFVKGTDFVLEGGRTPSASPTPA